MQIPDLPLKDNTHHEFSNYVELRLFLLINRCIGNGCKYSIRKIVNLRVSSVRRIPEIYGITILLATQHVV